MPPNETYNLVAIGAGHTGTAAAIGATELGAKVALIERNAASEPRLFIQAFAAVAHEVAHARLTQSQYLASGPCSLDFAKVRDHLASLARSDTARNLELARSKGIECFVGEARFLDPSVVEVSGQPLRFARALIATGSRVLRSGAPDNNQVLTSDDLLKIVTLPQRLAVVGANADAVAIAQSFARMGSQVTLMDSGDRLLPRIETRAVKIISESLLRDGVQIKLSTDVVSSEIASSFDCVIFVSPRIPQLHSLNLDIAKVAVEPGGRLNINEKFQTTNPRVYACGGVVTEEDCAHESEAQARCVIGNALFMAGHMQTELVSPRVVHTDPEIASVGYTPEDPSLESLEETSLDYPVRGYVRIVHNRKGDILGATFVAPNASELVGEIVLAINHQIKLGSLGADIHPHGAHSGLIKQCGDLQHRKLLTPKLAKSLSRFLKWRR